MASRAKRVGKVVPQRELEEQIVLNTEFLSAVHVVRMERPTVSLTGRNSFHDRSSEEVLASFGAREHKQSMQHLTLCRQKSPTTPRVFQEASVVTSQEATLARSRTGVETIASGTAVQQDTTDLRKQLSQYDTANTCMLRDTSTASYDQARPSFTTGIHRTPTPI